MVGVVKAVLLQLKDNEMVVLVAQVVVVVVILTLVLLVQQHQDKVIMAAQELIVVQIIEQAVEVVLVSFTTNPDIIGDKPECAMLTHWGPQGRTLFISEVTRRTNQPPVLSGWLPAPVATDLGPIDDGVTRGRDMIQRIWNTDADELRARIDAIRAPAASTDTDILPLTVDALREWGWID